METSSKKSHKPYDFVTQNMVCRPAVLEAPGVCSVQFSCSVMFDSLQPHGWQHTRLPCPSPTPRACSNSCPLSWSYHPIISSSVIPFSSCLQSFPESGSFPTSQLFASGGQGIGPSASASGLPMNIGTIQSLLWTSHSPHFPLAFLAHSCLVQWSLANWGRCNIN